MTRNTIAGILVIGNRGENAEQHLIQLSEDDKRLVTTDYLLNLDGYGKVYYEGITRFMFMRL
ncbi:MAG: hypothetical protein JGK17_12060 [Microcoleus sp. PH2017_10_PVI_O_A]|uniref:hypothetical protein n=1 Tax=unclassified Microcoleus TaxID=2642155 RepID=UPI001D52A896|nr:MULTISPECIES: hypothetical protein [unclassified Microcoleus]MCC3406302.1 hypothetical protein [Microcoleus sp. PH2017_10_PVI_O_A]MCC3460285.1 hypothetical protein [Microcoleus sp. PH2017_11_PCY_U_A]MCC3478819.1 hypothetical protein [Microcoleus sp. PH2017_12_PCY_D_A]MCC3528431.1 hypothetical protein [Microcoleus sp. PH2017_21_RUC_O_A]MCC3540607.1 hypothetical protein [Microcoleus sp. PH2017_22_RUC_O_B]